MAATSSSSSASLWSEILCSWTPVSLIKGASSAVSTTELPSASSQVDASLVADTDGGPASLSHATQHASHDLHIGTTNTAVVFNEARAPLPSAMKKKKSSRARNRQGSSPGKRVQFASSIEHVCLDNVSIGSESGESPLQETGPGNDEDEDEDADLAEARRRKITTTAATTARQAPPSSALIWRQAALLATASASPVAASRRCCSDAELDTHSDDTTQCGRPSLDPVAADDTRTHSMTGRMIMVIGLADAGAGAGAGADAGASYGNENGTDAAPQAVSQALASMMEEGEHKEEAEAAPCLHQCQERSHRAGAADCDDEGDGWSSDPDTSSIHQDDHPHRLLSYSPKTLCTSLDVSPSQLKPLLRDARSRPLHGIHEGQDAQTHTQKQAHTHHPRPRTRSIVHSQSEKSRQEHGARDGEEGNHHQQQPAAQARESQKRPVLAGPLHCDAHIASSTESSSRDAQTPSESTACVGPRTTLPCACKDGVAMGEGEGECSSTPPLPQPRPVGVLTDLPPFDPAHWPTSASSATDSPATHLASSSSSSSSTGSLQPPLCSPSPEDHFLTPRAGSPFFPTSMSGPSLAPVSMDRNSSDTSFHSIPATPSPPPLSDRIHEAMEEERLSDITPADDADGIDASLANDSSSTVMGVTSSGRLSSSPLSGSSSPASSSATPIATSRQASRQSTTADDSDAPLDTQELEPASPVPSSWSAQLRASLIAEGLSETAVTAEQEIRSLISGTANLQMADSAALPPVSDSATSHDLASRTHSSSSEISRTPSTSTACSLATSQASAETAPSSVPSESEGTTDDKPAGPESSGQTPILTNEKSVQAKVRRYHALLELVDTERSYAEDLSILVHVYLEMLPLQPFFEDHPARVETVVRNTPELLNIHNDIADFLEQTLEKEGIAAADPGTYLQKATSKGVDAAISQIGTFFCNLDQRFTAYRVFCARHAETLAVVRDAERRHNGDDFAAFERLCSNIIRSRPGSSRNSSSTELNRLSRNSSYTALSSASGPATPATRTMSLAPMTPLNPELGSEPGGLGSTDPPTLSSSSNRQTGRLKFADLLIKPVQRLCLYPLVLHTLLKHTGPEDVGKEELEAAMATMKKVADDVDEAGKRREQFLFAELVASRLDPNPPVTKALLSRLGRLELSGTLDVLYHSAAAPLVAPLRFRFLGIFLYKDWLLIAKVTKSGSYQPRHWFPLNKAELGCVEEHEGALPHAFRVTINHEHHFELAASSSRERAIWVDALLKAVANVAEWDARVPANDSLPCSVAESAADLNVATLGRSSEVVSRSTLGAEGAFDPLGDFLQRQSNMATTAEVLVRYASLPQRAVIDRGMIFSDSVLSARAITQKDGTFTPGGSLTRNSPGSTQTPTPTGSSSTVNLTSWHAATNAPTSSLGAAVGAAMGLARAAKRSSKQSVTNVFEAAAQQYLANEELRLAEEGKAAAQILRNSAPGPASRAESGVASTSGTASRPGLSQRRKRASFAIGPSSRPLNTLFANPSSGASPYLTGAELPDSPVSASSPTSGEMPGSDGPTSGLPSSGQVSDRQSKSDLKRRQSVSGAAALRDAIASAGAWSRRGRSQSTELDTASVAAGTPSKTRRQSEQVSSPQSACFSIDGSDVDFSPGAGSPSGTSQETFPSQRKLTSASAPATRPPSARNSQSGSSPVRRERSQTVASPEETMLSSGAFPFESPSGSEEQHITGARADPPPRRRTASSFSGSFMGPPMGSLKRNLSFNRRMWTSGGNRSEASSRRSSIIDPACDIAEGEVSEGPYPSSTPASSSQISLASRLTSFGRSATEADLSRSAEASTRRPSKPRSLTAVLNPRRSSTSMQQPQQQQPSTATTAVTNVKAKGSVSSSSGGSGSGSGSNFLTRTFSKRSMSPRAAEGDSGASSNKDTASSPQATSPKSRGSRALSLRRFTSHSSPSQGMPTPLAEESERTSFDFGPGAAPKP